MLKKTYLYTKKIFYNNSILILNGLFIFLNQISKTLSDLLIIIDLLIILLKSISCSITDP